MTSNMVFRGERRNMVLFRCAVRPIQGSRSTRPASKSRLAQASLRASETCHAAAPFARLGVRGQMPHSAGLFSLPASLASTGSCKDSSPRRATLPLGPQFASRRAPDARLAWPLAHVTCRARLRGCAQKGRRHRDGGQACCAPMFRSAAFLRDRAGRTSAVHPAGIVRSAGAGRDRLPHIRSEKHAPPAADWAV